MKEGQSYFSNAICAAICYSMWKAFAVVKLEGWAAPANVTLISF